MDKIKYIIYQEGGSFVAQCLNVDVSSFGETIDEASLNLKEAIALYFQKEKEVIDLIHYDTAIIGEVISKAELIDHDTFWKEAS